MSVLNETSVADLTTPPPADQAEVQTINIEQPASSDDRSFMESFVEDAASQMEKAPPAAAPVKKEELGAEQSKKEEPKKEETKKEAPKKEAVQEEKVPKGLSAEAGRVFKEMKKEIGEFKIKIPQLEESLRLKEAELVKANTAATRAIALEKDLQAKSEQLTQQAQAIELIRLESSDLWQNEVQGPIDKILVSAGKLAKEYDLPEAELIQAITSNDKTKLATLLADIPDVDRYDANGLRKKYAEILEHRDDLQKKGGERLTKLRADEEATRQREQEQIRETRTREIGEALPAVQKNIMRFITDPKDKANIEKALEIAGEDSFHNYPARVQAAALVALSSLAPMIRTIEAKDAEITQLKADNAGFQASDPGAGGGGQKTPPADTSVVGENDNFMSGLGKIVQSGGAAA